VAGSPPVSEQSEQTFLIGPELYLRPLEPSDAESAPIWDASPVPRPPDVVRERLEEQIGGDIAADLENPRLLIVRRSDDRPVGALSLAFVRGRLCRLDFVFDRLASRDAWAEVCSQTLRIVIPWLLQERSMMMVFFSFPGEHPLVEETTAALGMRRCYRARERVPVAGKRFDSIGYEALHPAWVAKLGMPRGMEEGPEVREVRRPAPLTWNPTFAPPDSAIVVGDRLYLRAFTPEDAENASRLMRCETEIFAPQGRLLTNPYVHARNIRETAKQEFPGWFHFAIVMGETGEVIGSNGLLNPNLVLSSAETETSIWTSEYRNKGYGTEAKHLLLEYCFDRLNLHMVYSWVAEFNTRSCAALRKQGYRDAGYIAWGDHHGTEFYGGLLFDLLASEWRAARRQHAARGRQQAEDGSTP
jgi:RimJ/RimL family protein N-acetyltransferase